LSRELGRFGCGTDADNGIRAGSGLFTGPDSACRYRLGGRDAGSNRMGLNGWAAVRAPCVVHEGGWQIARDDSGRILTIPSATYLNRHCYPRGPDKQVAA
jgi:hypothetical protein